MGVNPKPTVQTPILQVFQASINFFYWHIKTGWCSYFKQSDWFAISREAGVNSCFCGNDREGNLAIYNFFLHVLVVTEFVYASKVILFNVDE